MRQTMQKVKQPSWTLKDAKRVVVTRDQNIVVCLRAWKTAPDIGELCERAADEIERLKTEITRLGWQISPEGMGR
jgi:hypothetical protein